MAFFMIRAVYFVPMNNSNQIALALVVISIIWKFTVYTLELDNTFNIYLTLLFILVAAFFGIYQLRKQAEEDLTFVMEFKAAMQPVAIYLLLFGAFLFAYYKFINPNFLSDLHAQNILERVEEAKQLNYSKEQINTLVERLDEAKMIYTPFVWSSITLFITLFIGLFYSLLLTLILRLSGVREKFTSLAKQF